MWLVEISLRITVGEGKSVVACEGCDKLFQVR